MSALKVSLKRLFALLLVVVAVSTQGRAATVNLTLPSFGDGSHAYYHELLTESLEAAGHHVQVTLLPEMPQKRVIRELAANRVSLYWLLKNKKRDSSFSSVEVGLTNGLIGQRVLFIRSGEQQAYDRVSDLSGFRTLGKTGAFGANWYDAKVWDFNGLDYQTVDGDWHNIYRMLSSGRRGIDYFSRGVNEITLEAQQHPYLEIEKTLTFYYERDFVLYLSPQDAKYRELLDSALRRAKASGLMQRLIQKHWGSALNQLELESRKTIFLELPTS